MGLLDLGPFITELKKTNRALMLELTALRLEIRAVRFEVRANTSTSVGVASSPGEQRGHALATAEGIEESADRLSGRADDLHEQAERGQ